MTVNSVKQQKRIGCGISKTLERSGVARTLDTNRANIKRLRIEELKAMLESDSISVRFTALVQEELNRRKVRGYYSVLYSRKGMNGNGFHSIRTVI